MWFCLLKILASAVWQETESELQSFALAQQHYQRATDDHDHQYRKKKDRDLAHDQELKVLTHLGEEFWRELGHDKSIHLEAWPQFDAELTRDETVTVVVQVNGKVRDRLQVPAGMGEAANTAAALSSEAVIKQMAGKSYMKVIYVPDKLVNIVV